MSELSQPQDHLTNNSDFLSNLNDYQENLRVGTEHSPELRHTDEWPVDLATPGAVILGWYGAENFLQPEPFRPHNAIDIFCRAGTPVTAPSDGFVMWVDQSPGWHSTQDITGHMADVIFVTTSGIAYTLVHLEKASLNAEVMKIHGINGRPVFFESGSVISRVASWVESSDSLNNRGVIARVPKHVVDSYHANGWEFGSHLHVSASKVAEIEYINGLPWVDSRDRLTPKNGVYNPLVSFNRL